jgi:serine/threonine protein kinase
MEWAPRRRLAVSFKNRCWKDSIVMWNRVKSWLGLARNGGAAAGQAHMTFGQTSIGRTVSRTGLLLKKQLWVWPILAVLMLGTVGYLVTESIHHTMESNLTAQLETLLHVEQAMVEKWLQAQEANALTQANDKQIRRLVAELLETMPASAGQLSVSLEDEKPQDSTEDLKGETSASPSLPSPAPSSTTHSTTSRALAVARLRDQIAKELAPGMSAHQFVGFFVTDREHRILATNHVELAGETADQFAPFLKRPLDGETTVCPPFSSLATVKDENGRLRTGVPTMFACAPIRDENLQVIAVLSLRIRPEREFTKLVQLGRIGDSGETYAFDRRGVMVSASRFEDQLTLLGLVPDTEDASSILTIQLRDPGGDLMEGFRPKVRRGELPLTRMAAQATAGKSGVDVSGYADYRGVQTVGAWVWLPKYEMGLATELDYEEAFRALNTLKRSFHTMFGLLVLSAAAIFAFTLVVTRLQREARKAAVEAKQLGQYRLEERIGEGAMGVVYRGCHAMLRRPTAIKLLNVEKVNEASIERFEREVQITCQLNNPHTVAIYDYGRTPEGVFYYAMEYLDGIDLQQLVDDYGPQPAGRVVSILRQICSSLYEAHTQGLVHRDIKPANIMLNRRGGEPDAVKVLDFGLVKAMGDGQNSGRAGAMTGTPLYMSPESIQAPDLVDARSDLYAVGAVGYFLLTGQPVFVADTLASLCQQHLDAQPIAPSLRAGREVSPELENALLACLEKNRAKRPQTARDLAEMLSRVAGGDWSLAEAEAWWNRHDRQRHSANLPSTSSASSGVSGGGGAPNATSATAFDRTLAHD